MPSVLAILIAAGVAGVTWLLYAVPDAYVGALGLAPEGARRFQEALPITRQIGVVSEAQFVWLFRGLAMALWLLWITLVARGFAGHLPSRRFAITAALLLVSGLALLCPPVLSRDVFAYVAYGRLQYLHGLNPYLNDRAALEAATDPAARFLIWTSPLPYGPLWTWLAAFLGWAGHIGGLYGEVLAHKTISGAALLVAAVGASRLADLRQPGRGPLTFVAVALNPLFLLEGPGTGHNDFIMVALLVWGALRFAQHRRSAGALLVGLAIAVKLVACVAVPWLLIEEWRRTPAPQRRRVLLVEVIALAAPAVLLSISFGGLLVVARSFSQQGGAPLGPAGQWIAVTMAAGVSLWAWRLVTANPGTAPAIWLTAWIPVAVVLVLIGTRQWFPWYVSWALLPALAGWDERHRTFTTASVVFGVLLMWLYSYRP